MNFWFWTSSLHHRYSNGAWVFIGVSGVKDVSGQKISGSANLDYLDSYHSVRCVAPSAAGEV